MDPPAGIESHGYRLRSICSRRLNTHCVLGITNDRHIRWNSKSFSRTSSLFFRRYQAWGKPLRYESLFGVDEHVHTSPWPTLTNDGRIFERVDRDFTETALRIRDSDQMCTMPSKIPPYVRTDAFPTSTMNLENAKTSAEFEDLFVTTEKKFWYIANIKIIVTTLKRTTPTVLKTGRVQSKFIALAWWTKRGVWRPKKNKREVDQSDWGATATSFYRGFW